MTLIFGQLSHMYMYIIMYLILTPSSYTENDKILDSYQNFVKGWVREVLVKLLESKRIIIGKVFYSYYSISLVQKLFTGQPLTKTK